MERETAERSRADRSLFVQELVLTTLSDEPAQIRTEPTRVCGTVARDFPRELESVAPKRPAPRGRPQVPPPLQRTLAPAPAPARHLSGTGTMREAPHVPPAYAGAATARRKPVRPVQASEPPPSH